MKIEITDTVWRGLSEAEADKALTLLKKHEIDSEVFRWGRKKVELNSYRLSEQELSMLANAIDKLPTGVGGARQAVKSLRSAVLAVDAEGTEPLKSVKTSLDAFVSFFSERDKYVYRQESGAWFPYYVSSFVYTPPRRSRDWTSPDYLTIHLANRRLGVVQTCYVSWYAKDLKGKTIQAVLEASQMSLPNEELHKSHLAEIAKWEELAKPESVGTLMLANGQAEESLDDDDNNKRWWMKSARPFMSGDDGPEKVIVDVLHEQDDDEGHSDAGRDGRVDMGWWTSNSRTATKGKTIYESLDEQDDDDGDETEADVDPTTQAAAHGGVKAIPIHPVLPVFHVRRGERMVAHISKLEEHVYDTKIGSRLVLPADTRDILDVLLSRRGALADVVKGKAGGVTILTAGPPGTGKTLTAEILSEVMKRPLYAVQTAQLGVNAEELEKNLTLAFRRATRWKAILLLDEADVYVRRRGDDMIQNAIVGVFLRTMEYFPGVMLMTTNRMDLVDDAIASRCIARIDFRIPQPEDQKKIWRLLADVMELKLPDATIDKVVSKYPHLSGRDIKQLLKLCKLYVAAKKLDEVTLTVVNAVAPFKSTVALVGDEAKYADRAGGTLELGNTKVTKKLNVE